jgi:homocysteine S-methyltransferase
LSGITLLDGGMGTELRARGFEVPDHIRSIWSAKALLDAPEAIVQIHRDYIDAGAEVITANNYMVTPQLLAREGLADRFETLTLRALELADQARRESGRSVRVAGSLPPLRTSYRANEVGDDAEILADYRRIAKTLAPNVDIMLCETLSSAREARAAVTAACETGSEVWLSWTLQGDRLDRLPSGETVAQAHAAIAEFDVSALMFNCCGANFVTSALKILRGLTDRPIGGYANSANVIEAEASAPIPEPEQLQSHVLDIDGYTHAVEQWIDAGATVVGGCCSTRPEHIARLRALIDTRGDMVDETAGD